MEHNLKRTRGLIFSSKVLLALVDTGITREDAYAIVQAQRHDRVGGYPERGGRPHATASAWRTIPEAAKLSKEPPSSRLRSCSLLPPVWPP